MTGSDAIRAIKSFRGRARARVQLTSARCEVGRGEYKYNNNNTAREQGASRSSRTIRCADAERERERVCVSSIYVNRVGFRCGYANKAVPGIIARFMYIGELFVLCLWRECATMWK